MPGGICSLRSGSYCASLLEPRTDWLDERAGVTTDRGTRPFFFYYDAASSHSSASDASVSRHVSTSAIVTYSSALWRPAPPGPKRTDGIPALPRIAASV